MCLEANTYAGGMAATVELIDGFRYEIAGSVQFPTASQTHQGSRTRHAARGRARRDVDQHRRKRRRADGLLSRPDAADDALEREARLRGRHRHGRTDRLESRLPRGRSVASTYAKPPKTLDEMYACATNDAERRAIHEMLFGSAMDVIDRYLPDKDKHAVMRGMLAFLAVNSTYRGPYTPGSATCLAFALAVPDDSTAMMTKLKGGIGALTEHLRELFESPRRRDPLPHQGRADPRREREVSGVRLRDGSTTLRADRGVQPVAGRHADRTHCARTCSCGTCFTCLRS